MYLATISPLWMQATAIDEIWLNSVGIVAYIKSTFFILKFGQNQKSPEKMDFSGFTFTSHFRPLVVVSKTLFNQPNIYRNSTIFQRGRFIFDDFQFWPNPTLPTYILIKQKVTLQNLIKSHHYLCPVFIKEKILILDGHNFLANM